MGKEPFRIHEMSQQWEKEGLASKSSFEIYFDRKSNELIQELWDAQDDPIYEEVYELPTVSDYQGHHKWNVKVCEKARTKCKRNDEGTMEAHAECYIVSSLCYLQRIR